MGNYPKWINNFLRPPDFKQEQFLHDGVVYVLGSYTAHIWLFYLICQLFRLSKVTSHLLKQNYKIQVLKEKVWIKLSENISVMSLSTKIQDTVLLIKVKNDIFINLNDSGPVHRNLIKKIAKPYKRRFLLCFWRMQSHGTYRFDTKIFFWNSNR